MVEYWSCDAVSESSNPAENGYKTTDKSCTSVTYYVHTFSSKQKQKHTAAMVQSSSRTNAVGEKITKHN